MTKAQIRRNEQRIAEIFRVRCDGIQVSIWDLSAIAKVGHAALAEGASDEVIGDRIAAFVETVRKN